MNCENIRLGVHYHQPVKVTKDGYYCSREFGLWIDSLSPFFRSIVLILHSSEDRLEYKLCSKNVEFVDLGPKPDKLFSRILKSKSFVDVLLANKSRIDCLGCRVPTTLAIYFCTALRDIPVFFLVVGSLWRISLKIKMGNFKRFSLVLYWFFDHLVQNILSRRVMVFANGDHYRKDYPLARYFKRVHTSTITSTDIVSSKARTTGSYFTIIYLGRIESEKALAQLVKAVSLVSKEGYKIRLVLVGADLGDESNELKHLALRGGLDDDQIELINRTDSRNELFGYLDRADVMVIPSLWDSQPRVAWEAMARGLPLICSTGVQSFPYMFENKKHLLFFKVGDIDELKSVIIELIEDDVLYKKLSSESLKIARSRTLEASANLIVRYLEEAPAFLELRR